jgi:hypothetical protein
MKRCLGRARSSTPTNIFVDSITVASRHAFAWSQRQPEAFSEKTGKPDTRGAYGLMGREMVTWLTQLQHSGKASSSSASSSRMKDDFGRIEYVPQMEGSKTGRELPGIFDQVITGGMFVIRQRRPCWTSTRGRSAASSATSRTATASRQGSQRRLAALEAPDLGALLKKLQSGPRVDQASFAPPSAKPHNRSSQVCRRPDRLIHN